MFGIADLRYHTLTNFDQPYDLARLQEIWYQTEKDVYGIDCADKLYPFASFGHLMGGYDSGTACLASPLLIFI